MTWGRVETGNRIYEVQAHESHMVEIGVLVASEQKTGLNRVT